VTLQIENCDLQRSACLVDGEWLSPDGDWIDVLDPSNGTPIGRVPSLGTADVEGAIDAAERAQVDWAGRTAAERGAVLRTWYDLIVRNVNDLATIMTAEQGKPLGEARDEVLHAASFVDWFAEEGKRTYGDVIPATKRSQRIVVLKQPIGICAAITPWNFPAAMVTRKVAPALAAGCAMIVKPAEQTPLTALALGQLAVEAGLPAGVLQIVTGDARAIGGVLTASPKVRKLSFTGSTEVGRILMAQCAPTVKRVSLELGGNAPFTVFDDADLDAAVDGAIASKFRNAGQTCVCSNRFYVQAGIYDAFASRFAERVAKLKVGAGTLDGVDIGPLIDEVAIRKVQEHVDDALTQGAALVIGGRRHALGGTFYEPTVVRDARQNMRVAREETFGPVAAIFRFEAEEEAIAMANDTEFGLAAYVYTESARRAWRVVERLEYGMVGHNTGMISTAVAPFGGIKQSGQGREGSKYGIEDYLETKYWCSDVSP